VIYGHFWLNDTGEDRNVGYVLQYWIFYYFDDWQNAQYKPTLWQFHEGDWEEVSVGLTRDGQPMYVGTSRHCTGRFRFWDDVTVRGTSHPTIYVARGSHANYFEADSYVNPPKCLPKVVRRVLKQLHMKPRDQTGAGQVIGYGGDTRIIVLPLNDDVPPWRTFQGAWGEGEFVRWRTRDGTVHRHAGGGSPTGPAQKGVPWTSPVHENLHDWSQERPPQQE
jgi:hypothetical protein